MKSISKKLVESFGYTFEADATADNTVNAATDVASLAATKKSNTGKVAGKIGGIVTVFMGVKEAYDQITALPTDMPKEEYSKQVTKIVSKIVAEYGLVYVGGILGVLLGGVLGPGGGIVGGIMGITGGVLAQYTLGDSVDKIVDEIVDALYTEEQPTATATATEPSAEVEPEETSPEEDIKLIQTGLKQSGYNLGPTGVDGKFGKFTFGALTAYSKANGVSEVDGLAKLLGVQPETVAESISNLRNTLKNIEEARVADLFRNFKGGLSGTRRPVGAATTAAERAAQDSSVGFMDMNRAATAGERAAHTAGRVISAPVRAGYDIVKKTGGALSKYAGNHKFLATIAALGAAGYAFNNAGKITSAITGAMGGAPTEGMPTSSQSDPKIAELQQKLKDLGYPVEVTGVMDEKTKKSKEWEWGGEYGKGSEEIRKGLADVIKSTTPKSDSTAVPPDSNTQKLPNSSDPAYQRAVDFANSGATGTMVDASGKIVPVPWGNPNFTESSELSRILELIRK